MSLEHRLLTEAILASLAEATRPGVVFHHHELKIPLHQPRHVVVAYHPNQNNPEGTAATTITHHKVAHPEGFGAHNAVGYATFVADGKEATAENVFVDPKWRRMGVASGIYDHAKQTLGADIVPSNQQSYDGAAFWQGYEKNRK
jgi:GNAT superfamily N-acetyltransferase